MKDHFLLQQTGLEDTRPSSKPVQLKHVVWRPCTTKCCFFREMGKKKPFLPFSSYLCIVKQLLHFTSNSYNWGTKASSYYRSKTMINNNYQQWLVNMTIIQQSHCLPVNCRHQHIEAWQLFSLNTASLLRTRGEASAAAAAASAECDVGCNFPCWNGAGKVSLDMLKSMQRSL